MSRIDPQKPQPAQGAAPPQGVAGLPNGLAALTDGPFAANLMLGQMASQITQEIVDFAGRRMRAQMDFVSTLPMGDMKGMIEAQFRFMEQASRDYADEISHVSEVIRKVTVAPVATKD